MNTSLGWLVFGRVAIIRCPPGALRIEPWRTLMFDLSPEDVVTRTHEAERTAASGTPLSVRGLAAHICLINGRRSVLVAFTARRKSSVYRPVEVGVAGMPR